MIDMKIPPVILDLFLSIPLYHTFFCPSNLGRRHAKGALQIEHTYIWYTYSEKPLYEIKVRKGILTSEKRYTCNSEYWTDDGRPDFDYGYEAEKRREIEASRPPETQQQYRQSEVKRYVPYDPKDYSSSENFYDDNMDEFDSLDDAEDYYDEYGGEY